MCTRGGVGGACRRGARLPAQSFICGVAAPAPPVGSGRGRRSLPTRAAKPGSKRPHSPSGSTAQSQGFCSRRPQSAGGVGVAHSSTGPVGASCACAAEAVPSSMASPSAGARQVRRAPPGSRAAHPTWLPELLVLVSLPLRGMRSVATGHFQGSRLHSHKTGPAPQSRPSCRGVNRTVRPAGSVGGTGRDEGTLNLPLILPQIGRCVGPAREGAPGRRSPRGRAGPSGLHSDGRAVPRQPRRERPVPGGAAAPGLGARGGSRREQRVAPPAAQRCRLPVQEAGPCRLRHGSRRRRGLRWRAAVPGTRIAAADGSDAARRAGAGSRWRGGLSRPSLGFADAPRNRFYTCNRKSE